MKKWMEITDFASPELDIFARLNERQLRTFYEPQPGLFIAESPKVILRALRAGYEPVSILMEKREAEQAAIKEATGAGEAAGSNDETAVDVLLRCPDVPVYAASYEVLRQLTGFPLTRGLLCAMLRRRMPAPEQILKSGKRIAILEEVENPSNVGAVFRSAAALGVDGILLTAGCSDPLYRRAARVSMGTVFQVPWTYFEKEDWPERGMDILRSCGYKTAAMALDEKSVPIDAPELEAEEKLAVILGTEGDGLAGATIASCDYTVRIPMYHQVDSLNVAAASAVAFWQLCGRLRTDDGRSSHGRTPQKDSRGSHGRTPQKDSRSSYGRTPQKDSRGSHGRTPQKDSRSSYGSTS